MILMHQRYSWASWRPEDYEGILNSAMPLTISKVVIKDFECALRQSLLIGDRRIDRQFLWNVPSRTCIEIGKFVEPERKRRLGNNPSLNDEEIEGATTLCASGHTNESCRSPISQSQPWESQATDKEYISITLAPIIIYWYYVNYEQWTYCTCTTATKSVSLNSAAVRERQNVSFRYETRIMRILLHHMSTSS